MMYNMKNNRKTYSYKGVRVNAFGIPIISKPEKTFEKGYSKRIYHQSFLSPFEKSSPKNLIVIYDIPEHKKKERDWFRRHLKKFNFVMIQKSIWVGPSPLPKEFLDYIKEIGVEKSVKTFKLAGSYLSNP